MLNPQTNAIWSTFTLSQRTAHSNLVSFFVLGRGRSHRPRARRGVGPIQDLNRHLANQEVKSFFHEVPGRLSGLG